MNLEKEPIFKTKEEEVEWLKKRLKETTEELKEEKEVLEKGREVVKEHVEKKERIAEAYRASSQEIQNKVEELKKEPHQTKQVEVLLRIAQGQGIWNASQVAKGLQNPHLLDDFHDRIIAEKLLGFKIR